MNASTHPHHKKTIDLPVHMPGEGMWERIEAKLDAMDADARLAQKLEELPVHSPDPGIWNLIVARLDQMQRTRKIVLWTSAAAASLLLMLTAVKLSDVNFINQTQNIAANQNVTPVSKKAVGPVSQVNNPGEAIKKVEPALTRTTGSQSKNEAERSDLNMLSEKAGQENDVAKTQEVPVFEYNIAEAEPFETPYIVDFSDIFTDNFTPVAADELPQPNAPALKYYTPKEKSANRSADRFALAMNYLPENIGNGNGNSLFHNVDVAASYSKEKVRFSTSLGLAYNQEHYNYEMNYDQLMPVTAVSPTGHVDTVMYTVNNVTTDYSGILDHQYLTYNLGFGRRLFASGRFSSWLNAAAGFAVKLDNSSSHESTANTLEIMYNAVVHDVSDTKASYNNSNISLATGVDFNYRMFNKLSLTFAPTSRWYFRPMLKQDNKATDEFTVGFRTGIKYDF